MKTVEQLAARTTKKIKNRRQSMLIRIQQELSQGQRPDSNPSGIERA